MSLYSTVGQRALENSQTNVNVGALSNSQPGSPALVSAEQQANLPNRTYFLPPRHGTVVAPGQPLIYQAALPPSAVTVAHPPTPQVANGQHPHHGGPFQTHPGQPPPVIHAVQPQQTALAAAALPQLVAHPQLVAQGAQGQVVRLVQNPAYAPHQPNVVFQHQPIVTHQTAQQQAFVAAARAPVHHQIPPGTVLVRASDGTTTAARAPPGQPLFAAPVHPPTTALNQVPTANTQTLGTIQVDHSLAAATVMTGATTVGTQPVVGASKSSGISLSPATTRAKSLAAVDPSIGKASNPESVRAPVNGGHPNITNTPLVGAVPRVVCVPRGQRKLDGTQFAQAASSTSPGGAPRVATAMSASQGTSVLPVQTTVGASLPAPAGQGAHISLGKSRPLQVQPLLPPVARTLGTQHSPVATKKASVGTTSGSRSLGLPKTKDAATKAVVKTATTELQQKSKVVVPPITRLGVSHPEVAPTVEPQPLPPIPAEIVAFASLPLPETNTLPPIALCKSDLLIYEYIAKRARNLAETIESSLDRMRRATPNLTKDLGDDSKDSDGGKASPRVLPTADRQLDSSEQNGYANNSARNTDGDQDEANQVAQTLTSFRCDPKSPPRDNTEQHENKDGVIEWRPNDYVVAREGWTQLYTELSKIPKYKDALNLTWRNVLEDNVFIKPCHIGVAQDALLITLAQFEPCALTTKDKVGRYKYQDLGFVGLRCKHCLGQPGHGKYFPSSLASFVSSFATTGICHIAQDCIGCPQPVKDIVAVLDGNFQRSEPRMPSTMCTKGLMEHCWRILRTTKSPPTDDNDSARRARILSLPVLADKPAWTWDKVLGRSTLVKITDHTLVPDSLFVAFSQLEPLKAVDSDLSTFSKKPTCTTALRCMHCNGEDSCLVFPTSAANLVQVDNGVRVINHLVYKCKSVPPAIRDILMELEKRKENALSRKYGSRRMFSAAVWARMHGKEFTPGEEDKKTDDTADGTGTTIPMERLIGNNSLVSIEDRGMVSDAHFLAFSQLVPCTLGVDDQSGWYKDRGFGHPGVCCRHCGGRPGSGRYFPKAGDFYLRGSKNSIIRHLTEACPQCPEEIKSTLLALKRKDSNRHGWKVKDATVGHGKLFHERFFNRVIEALSTTCAQGQEDKDEESGPEEDEDDMILPNRRSLRTKRRATGGCDNGRVTRPRLDEDDEHSDDS